MPWGEQAEIFLILKDRNHTIIEQVFIRQRKSILYHLPLRPQISHPCLFTAAGLTVIKSDLIKLSDNLNLFCDPYGPGYWRFVEVALG